MLHGGNKPYLDEIVSNKSFLRKFYVDQEDEEFSWHRDKNDRLIKVISGEGWKFQHDNSLPFILSEGDKVSIKKNEWHRIIKGKSDLIIMIYE